MKGNQMARIYRDALMTITDAIEQHKVFFCARLPHIYEQLLCLVRRCRQLQRLGKRMLAQQLVNDELFKLFGVPPGFTDDRPLSMLAGVIRYVLISSVHMGQRLSPAPTIRLPPDKIRLQMGVTAEEADDILLAMDHRLNRLASWLPEHVSLLEMRYFANLGLRDMARELDVTVGIIKLELRFARASLTSADHERQA
jgi:DNA-directed RNA polymerase specialized sigma24 family protein